MFMSAGLKAFAIRALLFVALAGAVVHARAADMVPYLQTPTQNSMVVTWKSAAAGTPVVDFGSTAASLSTSVNGSSQQLSPTYHFHTVKLTGLSPDTAYFYRVRLGAQQSSVFRFKTPPSPSRTTGKFRFLVSGDHQIIDEDRHLVMLAAAKQKIESDFGQPLEDVVSLMVNDGDQVDVGTLDHYEQLHFRQSAPMSKNIPIMPTVGNHETYYDPGMTNWKAHFAIEGIAYQGFGPGPDERYYANQVGRVLFVHLDSEATSNTQKSWVQSVINAADADGTVDWVISVIHRPYQAEQYVGDISAWLRNEVMPILCASRKHVLNIAGHHHLYARGQTRDWPSYHMISGGNAWDQFWGQSTEQDFSDVQKTIANWSWQLVEIDLATREMTVKSYSEAHPKLGFVYHSKLTDEFHRKLQQGAPQQPAITNALPATITLPYTFLSSGFVSNYGEALNTTEFEFARDAAFSDVVLRKSRDFENLYGDTGAPNYLPVDINTGVDLLALEIPSFGLPNGNYFVRVRHRDRNVEWSAWSEAKSFTVTGSTEGAPQTVLAKRVYAPGEPVVVTYRNGTGNPLDWIGIYRKGQTPGNVGSTTYSYVDGVSGTRSFTGLANRTEYFAGYFSNDGYVEQAPRLPFYVGSKPNVVINRSAFAVGEPVVFNWTSAPGGSTDWLGIYRIDETPGEVGSTQWTYTPAVNGSATFNGLAKGYYYATFLVNDGYFEIIERIPFSVGDRIAELSMPDTALELGEDFDVSFTGGPGIAKDYLGIFRVGDVPGVDKLVTYAYVDGKSRNTVTFRDDLTDGAYFVALYTNDSYTEVSNRVEFVVGDGTLPPPEVTLSVSKGQYLSTEAVTLSWTNAPGGAADAIAIYRVGDVPGTQAAIQSKAAASTAGSVNFSGLVAGSYFAVFTANGSATNEIAPRANFKVVRYGDINGDGLVDLADRNVQRAAMGSCFGSSRYVVSANFDNDSCITQNDYKLWYRIYSAR